MKKHTALLAMAALGMLDVNRLASPLPYNPYPNPEPMKNQHERMAEAEAKRQRKAAKKGLSK